MGTQRTKIKICGITDPRDAEYCSEAGVDIIGVVLAPSKRRVTAERARDIVRASIVPVAGLFVNEDIAVMNRLVHACGFSYVQLSGGENESTAQKIEARVLRVLHIRDEASFGALAAYRRYDELIFDSAAGPGGSGVPFDWSLLAGRTERFFLAGGITADNAAEAMRIVHPYGIDVSSGVESMPGVKDHGKIQALIAAVRERE
ncbi:MAG: phosphoribosylanthranilate isomerase [Spirochaetota bacterium]